MKGAIIRLVYYGKDEGILKNCFFLVSKENGTEVPYWEHSGWYVGSTVENGVTRAIVQVGDEMHVVDMKQVRLKL